VQHLLGGVLARVQALQARQLLGVVAQEAQDVAGGGHAPEVRRGIVPQAGQQPPGRRVAQRRAREEDLGVGDGALAQGGQHGLQVAHAHVVGGHRQVVAPQPLACEDEVARGRVERLGRVEALVDHAAARLARADAPAARDAARQPLAGAHVDAHAEQVATGLGEDLGQPDGALEVGGGLGVGAPGALEQDDRLERVSVDAVAPGDAVDQRAPGGCPLGRDGRAAGALGVEDVAEPGGGAALVPLPSVGVVVQDPQRGVRDGGAGEGAGRGRAVAAAAQHDGDDDRGERERGGCDREPPPHVTRRCAACATLRSSRGTRCRRGRWRARRSCCWRRSRCRRAA
jgi:hypothetical protein